MTHRFHLPSYPRRIVRSANLRLTTAIHSCPKGRFATESVSLLERRENFRKELAGVKD